MFRRSTWLHLRIPFSFFLLPVFLFALSVSPDINGYYAFIVFISLHFFLYPASNAYNSYFDKDEKSIGGLRHPPRVTGGLYYTALFFDVIAVALGLFIGWEFALMLFVYGLVSKAYSHPSVRIKKHPYLSWFIAGLFQGAFTFVASYMGINDYGFGVFGQVDVLLAGLLTSAILWGSYPMTQIYQHEEDSKRGDITLSYTLGIRGTFYFTAAAFAIGAAGFFWYFREFRQDIHAWYFVLSMLPVLSYFTWWYYKVHGDPVHADYTHTMRLNSVSALCLNVFFIYVFLDGMPAPCR